MKLPIFAYPFLLLITIIVAIGCKKDSTSNLAGQPSNQDTTMPGTDPNPTQDTIHGYPSGIMYIGKTKFYIMDGPDMFYDQDTVVIRQYGNDSTIFVQSNFMSDTKTNGKFHWKITPSSVTCEGRSAILRKFSVVGDSLILDGFVSNGSRYLNRDFQFNGSK